MSGRELQMLGNAISFFMAGERCAVKLTFGSYAPHTVTAPAIVNYAFSIEILLKLLGSLSVNNYKISKNHDICELFEKLDSHTKDSINNNFREYFSMKGFIDDLEQTRIMHPENSGKFKSIFEVWRYSYDFDTDIYTSIGFLQEFFRSCYSVLLAKFPDFYAEYVRMKRPFSPCESWSEFQSGRIEILENPERSTDQMSDDALWDEMMSMEEAP